MTHDRNNYFPLYCSMAFRHPFARVKRGVIIVDNCFLLTKRIGPYTGIVQWIVQASTLSLALMLQRIGRPRLQWKVLSAGKGTGLGLSISSCIIKEMHAQLSVTGTPMQGTTVQLSVSLDIPSGASLWTISKQKPCPGSRRKSSSLSCSWVHQAQPPIRVRSGYDRLI